MPKVVVDHWKVEALRDCIGICTLRTVEWCGMKQLPGLSTLGLIVNNYGLGDKGAWKHAECVGALIVMGKGPYGECCLRKIKHVL